MKRIASFEVDHDLLTPGMYTSRVDGDITTYDVRMFYPNAGEYLYPAAAHTFEHLQPMCATPSCPITLSMSARWVV